MAASANDKILDSAIERAIAVTRFEANMAKRVAAVMRAVEDELTALVVSVAPTDVVRATYQKQRLDKLVAEARLLVAERLATAEVETMQALRDFAEDEAGSLYVRVNDAAGATALRFMPSKEKLRGLASSVLIEGAPSADWWSRQKQSIASRFADAVRKGMAAGESTAQLATRIKGTPAKDGKLAVSGVLGGIRRSQAEALVRTSVQTVANAAHLAVFEENADVMKGIMWVSTLDSRTTPICRALDGLMWDAEMNPIGHAFPFPGPTAHWGCRSTQVPVLKSWSQLAKEARGDEKAAARLDKLWPESTRASMDGQVPAQTTYEEWLRKKDPAFVRKVLGPTRARLWSEGKVSFTDLVSQEGRPLTLRELQAMDASLALDAAGRARAAMGEPKLTGIASAEGRAVDEVLQMGRDNGVENIVAYDASGNVVLRKSGSEHAVAFTDEDKWNLVHNIEEGTGGLVHNHPGPMTLSQQDLNVAAHFRIPVVAATPDGGVYRVAALVDDVSDDDFWFPDSKMYWAIHPLVRDGWMTPEQAGLVQQHGALLALHKELKIRYEPRLGDTLRDAVRTFDEHSTINLDALTTAIAARKGI